MQMIFEQTKLSILLYFFSGLGSQLIFFRAPSPRFFLAAPALDQKHAAPALNNILSLMKYFFLHKLLMQEI